MRENEPKIEGATAALRRRSPSLLSPELRYRGVWDPEKEMDAQRRRFIEIYKMLKQIMEKLDKLEKGKQD